MELRWFYMISEAAKKIRKPKPWKHTEPITRTQLMRMRDEFWDTAPHYGGQKGMLSMRLVYSLTECMQYAQILFSY
jgi:hypothetical protein